MKQVIAGVFALLSFCVQIKANPTETDLSLVDRMAMNTPSYACESIESLVAYGKANTKTEIEATRFFFVWIAQNIRYDSAEYTSLKRRTDKQEPYHVFSTRKALCRGYADLLMRCCQIADIAARTVTGYCKNTEGGDADSLEFHAWNIIKLDEKWHLFDVTWAANYLERNNNSFDNRLNDYFLQPATSFIKRHLPFDPVCQLSDSIVSRDAFFFENIDSKSYFGNVDSILNAEMYLDWIDLNIKSYERALSFIPEEKRLYDILSYFKSEKANLLFNDAAQILNTFRTLNEATITRWTYQDAKNHIEMAINAKGLLQNALTLYESMAFVQENEDTVLKENNMLIIHKNIEAADKLIAFLNTIEKEMKKIPITRK